MGVRFSTFFLFAFSAVLYGCGGGGGGAGPPATPPGSLEPQQQGTVTVQPAAHGPALSVLSIAGYKGDTQVALAGDAFEYSEDLLVRFSANLDTSSIAYSIAPQTAHSVAIYGAGVRFSLYKLPGTTYRITITAAKSQAGEALAQPFTTTLTTAPVVLPAVAGVAAPASPYRVGALEHPWSPFLVGTSAPQQLALLQQSGVGFARIDYSGVTIEPKPGKFDFSQTDTIADSLAARGLTELPVLLQYSPPGWSVDDAPYPNLWKQPGDFAAFAGAVAAHLRTRQPQIRRVEIFNEPNISKWWTDPNPAYASHNGDATAVYMRAAYAAIKAANPALTVVGPALGNGGSSYVDPRTFLQAMYAAGCRTGTCWDVLSVHEYAWTDPAAAVSGVTNPKSARRLDLYKDLQSIAVAQGDRVPHVMITEWGYSTDSTTPTGVAPAVQALYVGKALTLFNADPTIDGSAYVNVFNPTTDFWGATSLVDPSGRTKPAFDALRRFTGR